MAVALLEKAMEFDDGSGLIFPSPANEGKPLSDMTFTKILKTTGLHKKCVMHGFRSSFMTWAQEETEADYAVCELSLAHQVGDEVVRAYTRGDLIEKRRTLMQEWANYLSA